VGVRDASTGEAPLPNFHHPHSSRKRWSRAEIPARSSPSCPFLCRYRMTGSDNTRPMTGGEVRMMRMTRARSCASTYMSEGQAPMRMPLRTSRSPSRRMLFNVMTVVPASLTTRGGCCPVASVSPVAELVVKLMVKVFLPRKGGMSTSAPGGRHPCRPPGGVRRRGLPSRVLISARCVSRSGSGPGPSVAPVCSHSGARPFGAVQDSVLLHGVDADLRGRPLTPGPGWFEELHRYRFLRGARKFDMPLSGRWSNI